MVTHEICADDYQVLIPKGHTHINKTSYNINAYKRPFAAVNH